MPISLGSAVVTIEANTALLASGISGAKVLMADFAVSAATAAGAVLKMGGDFQQQNVMLVTSAGEAQKNLQMIEQGVLDVSTATGTSTDQLEQAMYKIESSGQRGKAALTDLTAAAEGAKLENSNLADVANAEMTVMTDYASKHITAAQAVNDLIATVAHGRANIQDMSLAMSTVLPTANAVGVSLYDTSAALSVMTARGTDAASAATYLKQMLLALDAPSSKATKTLAEIGLTTAQVSDEMKVSLPGALALIEDHLKAKFPEGSAAYVAALKDISGGSRTMQGILQLTGSSLQVFTQDAKDVAAAVQDGGSKIDGWALAQQNFNTKMDQAHAALDAVGIEIGTALLPVASQFLSSVVMPAIGHFQEWATQTTGLHDAFATVVTVTGDLITDTEHLVSWFAQGGVQGQVLKDALIGIGIAVATVKIAALASSLENLATVTIPQALAKYGLLTAATEAQTTATEASATQLTLWTGEAIPATTAADGLATAETEVATAGSGAAAGFTAMLGPLGLATGAIIAAANAWQGYKQSLPPDQKAMQSLLPNPIDMNYNYPWDPKRSNLVDTSGLAQLKQQLADIKQAWSDMNSLADEFNGKRLLGILDDPVGGVTAVDTKVMTLKTHLDDLTSVTVIGVDSKQVETADNKVRLVKTHLDDLSGPWAPQVGTKSVDAADLKVITLKSHLDDVSGTFTPSIGLRDVNAAIVQVSYLKSQLDDVAISSSSIPVGSSAGAGGPHAIGHASGGIIPPGQYGIVDDRPGAQVPELMYGGMSGISVASDTQTAGMFGGGSSGSTEVHNHIYLDGREMTSIIMNRAMSEIRRSTGVRR